jgi:hypothetical protein
VVESQQTESERGYGECQLALGRSLRRQNVWRQSTNNCRVLIGCYAWIQLQMILIGCSDFDYLDRIRVDAIKAEIQPVQESSV